MEDRNERQPLLSSRSDQQRSHPQSNGKGHLVEFEKDDIENPLEWTKKYRWIIVFFLSLMATTV